MCGLTGILRPGGLSAADDAALAAMTEALRHRGPDAEGAWTDDAAGIALGHRRLSILDPSPAGAQPMESACGRFVLVFNGEIYDFAAIRDALEEEGRAPAWRGHCDTEVLLAAIAAWGLDAALARARGMFALALWDRAARRLSLARDAAGEKPLHVAALGGLVLFGSELEALRAHPAMTDAVDRDAIADCLRLGYVPAPLTLWRDARKILPGEIVEIDAARPDPQDWWRRRHFDPLAEMRAARTPRFAGTAEEAADALAARLEAAVARQMVSDVPLGAFLSGGVDSATVVALMQAASPRPVECFTIGFADMDSEVDEARAMAAHLGANHHAEILTAAAARDLLAETPAIWDEPFADPSQLPTLLLAAFARRHVTVALSGDGADELFSGYGRHRAVARRWRPGPLAALARGAEGLLASAADRVALAPATALGLDRLAGRPAAARRLRLAARAAKARARHPAECYERRVALLADPGALVPGAQPRPDPLLEAIAEEPGWTARERIAALDVCRYLPDDILAKVDRAAMARSLETRAPFLDVDVMRLAFALPDGILAAGGERKGILKAVLARRVPRSLWERPKRGFGIPVERWLAGPLRPLLHDLLSRDALAATGVLDARAARAVLASFEGGDRRAGQLLWRLLVVQLHLVHQLGR